MKVGYIRVSSADQNTDRQLDGLELDKTFLEKESGVTREREKLMLCLDFLREGDELFVHSIDRLARSNRDLQNIVFELTEKKVAINFVTENIRVDNEPNPMRDMMLSMFAANAQLEVSLLKQRQREGIKKAKERGQKFGRKPLKPKLIKEINNRISKGQKVAEIALVMDVGTSTIYKYKNKECQDD